LHATIPAPHNTKEMILGTFVKAVKLVALTALRSHNAINA